MKYAIQFNPHPFIQKNGNVENIEDKFYIGNLSSEMNLIN